MTDGMIAARPRLLEQIWNREDSNSAIAEWATQSASVTVVSLHLPGEMWGRSQSGNRYPGEHISRRPPGRHATWRPRPGIATGRRGPTFIGFTGSRVPSRKMDLEAPRELTVRGRS